MNCNNPVLSAHAIKTRINSFQETGSPMKKMPQGKQRCVSKPQNIINVRATTEQSPQLSAHPHTVPLTISDRSLRQILHEDYNSTNTKSRQCKKMITITSTTKILVVNLWLFWMRMRTSVTICL
jgi:hypothetical protein